MNCQKCGAVVREGAKHCGNCGAPVSTSNKKKKKDIILIAAVVVSVALAVSLYCWNHFSENKDSDNQSAVSSYTAPTVSSPSSNSGSTAAADRNLLIYDKNGIKVYYLRYEYKYLPSFVFRVENNSKYDIFVDSDNVSLNGYMLTTSLLNKVAAGKKATANMTFFSSDLENNNITDFHNLEFILKIDEADNYSKSPIDDEQDVDIKFQ